MKALIDHYGYVPETCVWELTRACNLRCGHCGTGAGKPRPDELDTAQAIDVARQLARLGNRLTTLSGGEPTLREDWPEIARALVEAGVTVNLVTNGQGDGRRLAANAQEVGLANVAVSVDGLEETHDALRGRGAFSRAVGTIRELVGRGIWVDVMLTANRQNVAELPDVWQLASNLGVQRVRVQLGKPMGNQTHRDDLTLEADDLLSLLPLLGRLAARRGPDLRIGDSLGYFSPEERVLRGRYCGQGHWTGCYAGVRAIGIQADGSVKGCLSLQPRAGLADRFVEGSLREESLEAIWSRPGAFSYNRSFELGDLTGACAKCSHATLCRGGAKCVAYAYSGELGCDPMCYFHVAGLSEATRRHVWPLSASAAAACVMMSLGGCGGDTNEEGGSGGNSAGRASAGAAAGHTGGDVSVVVDYGVGGTSAGRATAGGATGHTGGDVSVGLDYGVLVPTGGVKSGGAAGAVARGGTGGSSPMTGGTVSMSGGRNPGNGGTVAANGGAAPVIGGTLGVTGGKASGSGGVAAGTGGSGTGGTASGGIVQAGGGAGTFGGYGGTASGGTVAGGATAGGEAGTAGVAGGSAIDCSTVCCNCEYGIIEPTVFRACCCESVCCECDYGILPPQGCC